jgi:hypothetical protein
MTRFQVFSKTVTSAIVTVIHGERETMRNVYVAIDKSRDTLPVGWSREIDRERSKQRESEIRRLLNREVAPFAR